MTRKYKSNMVRPKSLLIYALLLGALLIFRLEGIVRRQVYDTECQFKNQAACKVAARWGGVAKPLPAHFLASLHLRPLDKATCGNIGCHWAAGSCFCG
jgi:hypothetical protein